MTHEEFIKGGYDLTTEEVDVFMTSEDLKEFNEICNNLEDMGNG